MACTGPAHLHSQNRSQHSDIEHCKEIQCTFTNDIYLIQQAKLFHWSISKSKCTENSRLKRLGNTVFIISEKGLCDILLCFTFKRTKPSEIHKWKQVARKSSLFARLKYSLRAEISSATFQSWTRSGALIYKPWGGNAKKSLTIQ